MENKEPKKEYNKSQCVYGPNSKMNCVVCSALCNERYEDFKECGIKITFIYNTIDDDLGSPWRKHILDD